MNSSPESDEVHAARDLAPAGARVRDPHHQPECDRQVQRRKRFSGAARCEGINVGEYSRCDERHGQPAESPGAEPPLPDEVAGQERQHEETQIAGVEADGLSLMLVQLQPEERGGLDRQSRSHCKTERNDYLLSAGRSQLRGIWRHEHELLPEASRLLASEVLRDGVEVACALNRHQKRFISRKAGGHQERYLRAQMRFQRRNFDRADCLSAEIAAPFVDLFLERCGVTLVVHFVVQSNRLPVRTQALKQHRPDSDFP